MRQLLDTVWQRRGTSWIWDEEARNRVCGASEVWSLRQFLRAAGHGRIKFHPATDAVEWRCAVLHSDRFLAFGRVLWGEANEYPQEILLREGSKPAGLFHLRIT
jgi:hypothetical protein